MIEFQSRGPVLGFRLVGRVARDAVQVAVGNLAEGIARFGTVRLVLELGDLQAIQARALLADLPPVARYVSRVERVAVLGARDWETWWEEIAARLPHLQVQFFDPADPEPAWTWAGEEL